MKKRWAQLLLILGLAIVGATNLACSASAGGGSDDSGSAETASNEKSDKPGKKGDKDKDEKREEAVPVEVTALDRGPIEAMLRFNANLEAESEVKVLSEASRRVTKLYVEEGNDVSKGQILIQLQDDEQRSALAKAQSQFEKADREYIRQKRLYEQDLISEEAFNNATYELEQLRISLADAERELSYTQVRAPISGTITARMINLGDQISVGQHLFDIVDFNSMVARVFVPEKNLFEIRKGLQARIRTEAMGEGAFTGKIKRIAPVVDARTGTVKVTIDVGRQEGLRPGMYVDVDLITATEENALLVPKRALVYDNDQVFVFRMGNDRRVERVFIEPALADKYNVQPLDGLDAGDKIVVAGQAGLKDGALVSLPEDAPQSRKSEDVADDGTSQTTVVAQAE